MANTFTCTECGEELPVRSLSDQSLTISGKARRDHALVVLEPGDIVCQSCQDGIDDEHGYPEGDLVLYGRNEVERFELDGIVTDPARWQAYCLNY